ncbi:MAG TPA: AAA family ATPase, partial [Pirellulaceae bacterium]|nr:AAA family ATPase [Pirellulaceae bacterium]
MSFVGQWENRLLAILDHARRKDHVLYFDDVLGLFHAGVSRDASLSVADVLKPVLQRRKVRVVGEMTEEQWQTLQQRDRGLADCFHVVRVPAASSDEARRLLLALRRQLEDRHRCEFAVDVVPTVVALHERFVRDGALPGTAARFLQRTAARYERERLDRNAIYVEFATHSGLAPMLVDPHIRLLRPSVLLRLRSRVVGQVEALEALADVVMTTKAQLNSPDRPLGVFLMVGPTGVGKTETAKALAELLFNDEQRLLRFDMNEFVTPSAVARLVGTWDEPEGLLTSAVRQQPFAVILLDEIEKAHPDLFDLLLQITGEGRLTDALGRTADFSHTVVLMTSNLAADEARRRL